MPTAWAATGERGLELKASFAPGIVLIDLELPDTSGVVLVERLSQDRNCGIIIMSAHAEATARVVGLELGADDYMAKPVHLDEMAARIRAVHRRVHGRALAPRPPNGLRQVGPYSVDLQRRAVHDAANRPIVLTGAEFAALQSLLEAEGAPVSRARLSEAALRRPWQAEDRAIDQLILGLRRKLADGDRSRRLIQSVRGAGYVLAAER
jgi:two-component system phosphate regulon response regulator OmpR